MSLPNEIKTLLMAIPGVYIGSIPDTPDNVVGIYQTGGFPRGMTESRLEQPTFQIRVRNTSYAQCDNICEQIDDILHCSVGLNVLLIKNMGGINHLGRDLKNREEATMNYRTYYKK